MSYQELLTKALSETGMTQKAFAEYFGIPVRTLQDWLAGKRKMPDYLLRLMIYKLEIENMVELEGADNSVDSTVVYPEFPSESSP